MDTPTIPKRKTDVAVPPDLPPFLLVFVSSDAATHAPSDSFQIDRYDLFMKRGLKRSLFEDAEDQKPYARVGQTLR
ncbi:hypothetical protein QFZ47_001639 [Variovorax paradoxus]|nr:hypothetical protein [Variovorax paradoxus]MDQ0587530.1 hypothetical protein [Variovorax paradoxus]